eukprot:SAG31_NODE_2387_length_5809_cov_1.810683_1_plen_88_part_10
MPGDTGRGGAAPRRTRATAAGRASGYTRVETRRAGSRSAQVPAPAPEGVDIETGNSAEKGRTHPVRRRSRALWPLRGAWLLQLRLGSM